MANNVVEILLVEDNQDDAELALRALRKNNIANKMVHMEDGQTALDFLFARGAYEQRSISDQPKVILLDLKLPKVDGISVLKELKADPRTKYIPVVVLTASREEQDLIETYNLGVNSYIVKPVDFDRFDTAVRDLGMYWLLLNEAPPASNNRP